MLKLTLRSIALALSYVMVVTGHAHAAINRVGGPQVLVNEPRALVRFDSAFDTINRIYLVVWGTQARRPGERHVSRTRPGAPSPACSGSRTALTNRDGPA